MVSPEVQALLDEAAAAYNDAQAALRDGDLATYQEKVDEMNRLIRQARQGLQSQSPTTTAAPDSA